MWERESGFGIRIIVIKGVGTGTAGVLKGSLGLRLCLQRQINR